MRAKKRRRGVTTFGDGKNEVKRMNRGKKTRQLLPGDGCSPERRGAHWWVIDAFNRGECRFCHQRKDFGELLRKGRRKTFQLRRQVFNEEKLEVRRLWERGYDVEEIAASFNCTCSTVMRAIEKR